MEVSIRELKANLAAVLRQVQAGETAYVTSHGKPAARILPPLPQGASVEDKLLAAGLISHRAKPGGLGPRTWHKLPEGSGLLSDAVIEDRG